MSQDEFDAAVRKAHAASLRRLSPRVQAQLQQRHRQALAGEAATRPRPVLRLALASLAVCAVAIGLLRLPDGEEALPLDGALQAQAAPPADVLEQSPDFYAWLATDDARALAME